MNLQESGEMYLETLYILAKEQEIVRSIDLATAMGYSKPSISRAVHNLQDQGFLSMGDDGRLELTPQGLKVAQSMYDRHVFFSNYFIAIGVDPQKAIEDACSLEHVISQETFEHMKDHINTVMKWDDQDHYTAYLKNKQAAL
ncbi:MAG: metal-dependent transcriptional regulator [Eubacteriales bacterium]|nr:metal-dependent transcriptional regulator [Eubacteriales bacterium]